MPTASTTLSRGKTGLCPFYTSNSSALIGRAVVFLRLATTAISRAVGIYHFRELGAQGATSGAGGLRQRRRKKAAQAYTPLAKKL